MENETRNNGRRNGTTDNDKRNGTESNGKTRLHDVAGQLNERGKLVRRKDENGQKDLDNTNGKRHKAVKRTTKLRTLAAIKSTYESIS
jgi:hypothetical protein